MTFPLWWHCIHCAIVTLHWHGRIALLQKLVAAYNKHTFPGTELPEINNMTADCVCQGESHLCKPYLTWLKRWVPRVHLGEVFKVKPMVTPNASDCEEHYSSREHSRDHDNDNGNSSDDDEQQQQQQQQHEPCPLQAATAADGSTAADWKCGGRWCPPLEPEFADLIDDSTTTTAHNTDNSTASATAAAAAFREGNSGGNSGSTAGYEGAADDDVDDDLLEQAFEGLADFPLDQEEGDLMDTQALIDLMSSQEASLATAFV
jgi:hypothetical protein